MPKNVFFYAHVCKQNATLIFLRWQILFQVEIAAIPGWAQLCCECQGEESPPKEGWGGAGVEKLRLMLTSAKAEVEVEAELGNNSLICKSQNKINQEILQYQLYFGYI